MSEVIKFPQGARKSKKPFTGINSKIVQYQRRKGESEREWQVSVNNLWDFVQFNCESRCDSFEQFLRNNKVTRDVLFQSESWESESGQVPQVVLCCVLVT